jgi:hypothetical protein
MSQVEQVLQYLKDFGSITTFESYEQLGITRLPSRIWDLKQQGYQIEDEVVTKKNRYGKTINFKRYKLKSPSTN